MEKGYAYEFAPFLQKAQDESWQGWRGATDENWDIVVYAPDGQERLVGGRYIDGVQVRVYLCQDGLYRAQTASGRPV